MKCFEVYDIYYVSQISDKNVYLVLKDCVSIFNLFIEIILSIMHESVSFTWNQFNNMYIKMHIYLNYIPNDFMSNIKVVKHIFWFKSTFICLT